MRRPEGSSGLPLPGAALAIATELPGRGTRSVVLAVGVRVVAVMVSLPSCSARCLASAIRVVVTGWVCR